LLEQLLELLMMVVLILIAPLVIFSLRLFSL
jgi:hypothetical protein